MSPNDPGAEAGELRPLMALPGPEHDQSSAFHQRLALVLELVGGEPLPPPGPSDFDRYEWENVLRMAVATGLSELEPWPEGIFDALVRAIVLDPNPSFNRQLIQPALTAVGHRRVQKALLETLAHGTNAEKAGSTRAWYWTPVRPRFERLEHLKARIPTEESAREHEALADLRARWREATLREFVANDDLDVRRSILPGLSLKPADYPDDLKDLVATAVHLARTHPDEYIRHRVEHQI